MVLYEGLQTVHISGVSPRLDIVCVHSFGLGHETTWHDEGSGKSWIEDPDFVVALGWRARMMSFRYNSDLAANLSATSIAIHANDLLRHLEKALAKSDDVGLIFIAHGFGGTIVKRALRMRDIGSDWPRVRDATTGVCFLGTPHADTDSDALHQAVRNSVQLLRSEHHLIEEDDIRAFAGAVASINTIFNIPKLKPVHSISFWEEQPSEWKSSTNGDCSAMVIPKSCQKPDCLDNQDFPMDCKHLDMAHFADLFDPRFVDFTEHFTSLMNRTLEHKLVFLKRLDPQSKVESARHSRSSSPRGRARKVKHRDSRSSSRRISSDESEAEGDRFTSWRQRKQYEDETIRFEGFMKSLKGWSHGNTGHDVFVAAGTCEWISTSQAFRTWFDNALYGTFFWLAESGSGKTHIAKAAAAYIEKVRTPEVVLSFFCKGESSPSIWEYFTWGLLQARPAWFASMPNRFQARDAQSVNLESGDFIDIWTTLREKAGNAKETIWLVIDGLEQCGDDTFFLFWKSLEQLRKRQAALKRPSFVKVLLTGTVTPAMTAVAGDASRYYVADVFTKGDIARYVDARLSRCVNSSTLEYDKSSLEALRLEIKSVAGNYWPFARDAVTEVELALGQNLSRILPFTERLPDRLEAHVQQTVLSLRQSVGPLRFLYPALVIMLGNSLGPKLNFDQLKDALGALYGYSEVQNIDLADLLVHRCGGLVTDTGDGGLRFRHEGFIASLNRDCPPDKRDSDSAYLCMTYLLQDRFRNMPLPEEFEKPMAWLHKHHPFYSYAAYYCYAYLSRAGVGDDRLKSLYINLILKRPHQWRASRRWIDAELGPHPKLDAFDSLPFGTIFANDGLVPLFARVCPPPKDRSGLSVIDRTFHWLEGWLQTFDRARPRYELPDGWLQMRSTYDWTPLLFVAQSCHVKALTYVLKWKPNLNERGGPHTRPVLTALYATPAFPRLPAEVSESITRDLLSRGANPNLSDAHGVTPLHIACAHGYSTLVPILLDSGACVDVADRAGVTPWQGACAHGHLEIIRDLIAHGVDVDSLFGSGDTALTYLAGEGDLEALQLILPVADINLVDIHGKNAVCAAITLESKKSRYEVLGTLLAQGGIELDHVVKSNSMDQTHDMNTPLLLAVSLNDHRSTEMLLEAGASAGHLTGLSVLPLELAVRLGYRDVAELLLRHGAPVNEFLIKPRKRTALSSAADVCNSDMIKLLLSYGADPTIEDGLGQRNAAMRVVTSISPDIDALRMLLDCPHPPGITYHRELDGQDPNNYSSIFLGSCTLSDPRFAELLLNKGVDLSAWLDLPAESSPMRAAIKSCNIDICRLLLDREPRFLNLTRPSEGIDDFNLHSPLHEACAWGQNEIVKLLIERGADIELLTRPHKRSCLLLACKSGDYATFKTVLDALGPSKSMVTLASYTGELPLDRVLGNRDVEWTEELIKAGASLTQLNGLRQTCVSSLFFFLTGKRAIPQLRLLLKYGLEMNRPSSFDGSTPFYVAIGSAQPAVIRWMLEQGADPTRTVFHPTEPSGVWDLGLRALLQHTPVAIIDTFIQAHRDCLSKPDWAGQNALLPAAILQVHRSYLTRVYWTCEEILAETGQDIFADMMVQQDIFGLTPVDRAMGVKDCRPEARPKTANVTARFVDTYIVKPDPALLFTITRLLMYTLGYHVEEDIGPLLTVHRSIPGVMPPVAGVVGPVAPRGHLSSCDICRKESFIKTMFCLRCQALCCLPCVERASDRPCKKQEHSWFEVVWNLEMSPESAEVQQALQRIQTFLRRVENEVTEQELNGSSPIVLQENGKNELEALQSALQLATLHAFNMLAPRRRLWTTYLPLSGHAVDLIRPFEGNIAEMRKAQERRMLDEESTMKRRREEMRYMQSVSARTAYADEGLFRSEMILGELAGLFGEIE